MTKFRSLRTLRQKLNDPEAIAKRLEEVRAEARAKMAETLKRAEADKPKEIK